MTSRPRHLLDLPDEVLCLILAYCCEDLDFLLWFCPLVGTKNQLCQDCYHCTLCYKSISRKQASQSPSLNTNTITTRGSAPSDNIVTTSVSNVPNRVDNCSIDDMSGMSGSNSNNETSNETILRKRRRRTIADNCQGLTTSDSFNTLPAWDLFQGPDCVDIGGLRCQGNQIEHCHQYSSVSDDGRSFWSRHFTRFLLSSRLRMPTRPENRGQQQSAPPASTIASMETMAMSQPSRSISRLAGIDPLKLPIAPIADTTLTATRIPTAALSPIAFLGSIPLSRRDVSYVALQPSDRDRGFEGVQLNEKERTNAFNAVSLATRLRPRSLSAANWSYSRATRSCIPSTLGAVPTIVSKKVDSRGAKQFSVVIDSATADNGVHDHLVNAAKVSTPFHLLLVNKRLAGLAVQSLWNAAVFHGHDVCQMESLLSTITESHSGVQPHRSESGRTNEKHTDPERRRLSGFCATTHKKIEPAISSNALANSFRHFIRDKDQGAQLGNDFIGLYKMYPPVEGAAHSVSKSDPTQKNRVAVAIKSPSLPPLWPYHRHVKRVVLNFAHPQASPQMLVKVLERIGSCCPDQIQSLDLHANEKMQAAGLESPAELERLFGSNFSKLRYLRLQGGFIDNQLLGALLKGFATPASPRCRLSQVFLGPGSVTDSAIDKLIAAASHSLEVLTVTSCVDMSGGALANLLTNCPKLRVLSVYKVLARDKELLEGLGIDMENNGTQGSALESMISYPSAPSRREIVAPLERLELGTVKLTIVGVAEIIRGTCQTLRYLVLETQHLKDDFLRGVVASLCKRLEGLHFDDTNHPAQPQQRQSMQGYISNREQRRRRRFFDFGRTRGTLETQLHSLVHHAHMPSVHHGQASYHLLRRNRVAIRSIPAPRQSPWLGDTTTEEWVLYGDCSLWAMSSIGSSTAADNGGSWNTGDTRDGSPSASRSRVKGIFLFVRAIGRCLVSLLSDGHSHGGNVTASPSQVTLDSALASTSDSDTSSDAGSQDNYEILLGRFGVDPRTVEVLIKTLQPSLRAFTALQTDLIAGQGKASAELIVATECSTAVSANYLTLVDRDEIQLRLVMLLSVLVLGIVASLNTQKL